MTENRAWWHEKSLAELTVAEWESLCDGCAKCCLHKLQHEHTGEVFHTRVRCRYLDAETCRCRNYTERSVVVPDCVQLKLDNVGELDWMPDTCAYRLRARGEQLPDWHPLVSGDAQSVHRAGQSVREGSISEEFVHPNDLEDYIVRSCEPE